MWLEEICNLVKENKFEEIKRLVRENPDIAKVQITGTYLLHFAVTTSNPEMAELMLNHGGADVNAIDENHNTALHIAAQLGDVDMINLLLRYHADTTIESDGMTAAELTKLFDSDKHQEVAKLLTNDSTDLVGEDGQPTSLFW